MSSPRFLTLTDVAELLNVSLAQVYALVRCGDLPAVKIGGRGQWRVEDRQLERYIARMYDETATFIAEHPFGRVDVVDVVDATDELHAEPRPLAGRTTGD
jgi:excisionase family DNA binding protein